MLQEIVCKYVIIKKLQHLCPNISLIGTETIIAKTVSKYVINWNNTK